MALLRQALRLNQVTRSVPVALYHEKVIDHYENPRNVGKMDPKKINVGTGLVGAPACGDVMKLQIEVTVILASFAVDLASVGMTSRKCVHQLHFPLT